MPCTSFCKTHTHDDSNDRNLASYSSKEDCSSQQTFVSSTQNPKMALRIIDIEWDHPDGVSLRQTQLEELAQRYGTDDSEPGIAPTSADITIFIVAYIDSQPVGCGALRALDHSDYPGDAEVKRMFVVPDKRGRSFGVAPAILKALEERARSRGWRTLLLETGTLQPDAIRFYTREGYTSIPNFGPYAGEELSVCFQRNI